MPGFHFNPRSPQGERLTAYLFWMLQVAISIHAPRRGSDREIFAQGTSADDISIHAPRRGSDFMSHPLPSGERKFQSTLPAGGATMLQYSRYWIAPDFNPRSPQGERPKYSGRCKRLSGISIHAPRRGSDKWQCFQRCIAAQFQSTLPAGGATGPLGRRCAQLDFNPRSPQGERPDPRRAAQARLWYFNPRSPQGERQASPSCARATP